MRMSVPVRIEFPCAAAIGRRRRCAAQCPNPRRRSQRLPSTAVAHAARYTQAYVADRRQHGDASPRDWPAVGSARSWFWSTV